MVIQALSQLRDTYGAQTAETMMQSVAARIIFAPRDYPDAREISDNLGLTTVKARSHSRPTTVALNRSNSNRSTSVNTSDHARALLLPQEVKEIGVDNAIIFLENVRAIRCKKIRYYADRNFRARLLPPPPRPKRVRGTGLSALLNDLYAAAPPGDGLEPELPLSAMREASLDVIDRIDSLTPDDFGEALRNFTPQCVGEHPTESELDADVQRFLEAIR